MAIVSIDHNFIFIHIFKCGGNSIRKAIGSPSVGSNVDTLKAKEIMGAHVEARDLQKYYIKEKCDFFDTAFKFTFVRNPFDWLYSTYCYIRSSPAHQFHKEVNKMTLHNFLEWYVYVAFYLPRPIGSNKYLKLKNFITDDYGNVIVDYIGKLETVQDDMKFILNKINLPSKNIEIVNKNVNRKAGWIDKYDVKSREFVEIHFKEDLKFFGYDFNGIVK